MTTRKTKASERPICRARSACSRVQRETRIEMNTTLSMPRMISSAINVERATQASGSVSSATTRFYADERFAARIEHKLLRYGGQ
jgi:hypothetical protein